MPIDKQKALADIDAALTYAPKASGGSAAVEEVVSIYEACIERNAPAGSSYRQQAKAARGEPQGLDKLQPPQARISQLQGKMIAPLRALRHAYENDLVGTFDQLVRADVFKDLLSQAAYLHDEGHDLPAAVVAGAALEAHLRALAPKYGVTTHDANGKARMASVINQELRGANAYTQAEERFVQGWLDIRNDAAHGLPNFTTKYSAKGIEKMIDDVRDFLQKYPA